MAILVISFPETKKLAMSVARGLKAEYETLTSAKFPDGESKISMKTNPKGKTIILISSMALNPNEKIIETILAGGIVKDYGAKKVILFATYFPYMRQDTHFENYDSFSAKHVSKLFSEFDKVIAISPHLHRLKSMKLLSKKFSSINVTGLIVDYIRKRFKDDFTIVGPDKESSQWSKPVAEMLGRKTIVLKKHRYSSTRIKVHQSGNEKMRKNVLVIDDIISTGKTAVGALDLARKEGGKKFFCIGVHGLLIGNSAKEIGKRAEIITTNTVPSKFSKIDVAPAIVKELKRVL